MSMCMWKGPEEKKAIHIRPPFSVLSFVPSPSFYFLLLSLSFARALSLYLVISLGDFYLY